MSEDPLIPIGEDTVLPSSVSTAVTAPDDATVLASFCRPFIESIPKAQILVSKIFFIRGGSPFTPVFRAEPAGEMRQGTPLDLALLHIV